MMRRASPRFAAVAALALVAATTFVLVAVYSINTTAVTDATTLSWRPQPPKVEIVCIDIIGLPYKLCYTVQR